MNTTTKKIIISILANVFICFHISAISDALKIKVVNGTTSDETVIRFIAGATPSFDASFDSYKLFSTSLTVPAAFTKIDSATSMSINALPPLSSPSTILLYTHIKVAGTYTFQSIELGSGFSAGTHITLEDLQNGQLYNFRNGQSFSVTLPVNTVGSAARFAVHFTPEALTVINALPATCNGMTDGSITVTKQGNTSWDYELKNSGILITSATGVNETAQITDLAAGTYILYTHSLTSTADTSVVVITQPLPVISDFTINDDTVSLSNAAVQFTNNSTNAAFFSWNFGDGFTMSDSISPIHTYNYTGLFTVDLIAVDSFGCKSELMKDLVVVSNPGINPGATFLTTGQTEESAGLYSLSVTRQSGALHLQLNSDVTSKIAVYVYNNLGQLIYEHKESNAFTFSDQVQLNNSGTYVVYSIINGKVKSQKFSYIK